MDYSLKRWSAFTQFLDDGRICMTNNAAERAVRGVAVGRRNWTFCGSDAGGERAAVIFTLIETAKLCGVDPRAWLADVLDVRVHVTRRKVSGGTRSDAGRDCRDAFLGLMKTCLKQGVRFWDYLGARLAVPSAAAVPPLPNLIARPRPP